MVRLLRAVLLEPFPIQIASPTTLAYAGVFFRWACRRIAAGGLHSPRLGQRLRIR